MAFQVLALLVLLIALASLGALIWDIVADGAGRLSWNFITSFPSRRASQAGIWHALIGSIFVIVVTALIAVPIGVAAAIYLEEYGGRSMAARLIELNITNLAAVPSIIYGLLGLGLFVRMMGMGRSVLAGASTLALLVLPVVILSTREALRAVPKTLREGSYALGATKWQTIWHQVLPVAAPGILTGLILALSRAIGETAPLITHRSGHVRDVRARLRLVAVYRAAHSDLQLGVAAASRVSRQCGRRDPGARRAAPVDERRRDLAEGSLSRSEASREHRVQATRLTRRAGRQRARRPTGRTLRQDRRRLAELLLRREAGAAGHLDPHQAESSSPRSSDRRAAARAPSSAR